MSILANIDAAIEFFTNLPNESLTRNLNQWRRGDNFLEAPSCGSPACFGGWLPFIPHFAALGVTPHKGSSLWAPGSPRLPDKEDPRLVSLALFGSTDMFYAKQQWDIDEGQPTEKEVVLARLAFVREQALALAGGAEDA